MGIFRQEYWNALTFSPGWDLPDPPNYLLKSESEVTQSCLTLCDPMDCSLPGSSLHGSLQARVLEWGAISFSRGSSQLKDQTRVSRIPGRRFNLWATREANHLLTLPKSLPGKNHNNYPWKIDFYGEFTITDHIYLTFIVKWKRSTDFTLQFSLKK